MDLSTDGGLVVTKEMKELFAQPGYISVPNGGQRLRELYCDGSANLDPLKLSPFGCACYFGAFDAALELLVNGKAPPLDGTETAYKFGYAILIVGGAQRVSMVSGNNEPLKHPELLQLLIDRGMPVDLPDIAGFTALFHATGNKVLRLDLARILLQAGANPNYQNRYGEVPLLGIYQFGHCSAIDLLMEHGADLNIADADKNSPNSFYLFTGPQVTATVRKWIKKLAGEEAPRTEKRCDNCGATDKTLKNCGKCRVARYCTVECQRKHWAVHKSQCLPFTQSTTVTLKPCFNSFGHVLPTHAFTRNLLGIPTNPTPPAHYRGSHVPKPSSRQNLIIKVQVPWSAIGSAAAHGDLLVYTKKRDLVCTIQRKDDHLAYDRIVDVVRRKGPSGAKAYFAAELRSEDELVVKISEVLAEQPF